MSSLTSVRNLVEARQQAENAPERYIRLATDSSHLEVRKRGGFITRAALTSPTTGELVEVLYAEANRTSSKLRASHSMSPVGPSDGIGGQHGFPRWMDYELMNGVFAPSEKKKIILRAKPNLPDQRLVELLKLEDSALLSSIRLTNTGRDPLGTSMGKHYYFTLKNGDPEGLLLDGKTIDEIFEPGTQDAIRGGESRIISDFDGSVDIHFPAGHDVRLSAEGRVGNEVANHMLQLMLWHLSGEKPGEKSESFCIEPTFGYVEDWDSDHLHILPDMTASLFTSIEVL